MKGTLVLLSPHLISLKNSVTPSMLLKRTPFIIIGGGLWAALYFGSINLLKFLRALGFSGDVISMKLLSMVFFSLTVFLLLSNVITAVSAFYMSKDLPLLLSKPVEEDSLRTYKTVEAIVQSSWMVLFFIPPLFLAYGVSYGANWRYYAAFSLVMLPMIIIPAGAGIAIAHILARVFPARRTRDVLLGAGLLLFLLVYIFLKSAASDGSSGMEGLINSLLQMRTELPFLPGFWMTETVSHYLHGRTPELIYPFVLISTSAFSMVIAGFTGSRLYIENIFRMNTSGKKARWRGLKDYPAPGWAVCWKEIRIFSRDAEQWSQLVIIGALLMVYVYNFRAIPMAGLSGLTPFLKEIIAMLNIVLAGLVLTAVAARFLYVAVSLEGQVFWLPKAAPITMRTYLWNKYLFGFTPITLIIVLLVFITDSMLGLGPLLTWLSTITVFMLCLSVSGLATGLGAMNPQFKYENIASVSMGPESIIFMLIAFTLVIVTVTLEGWALYLYKGAVLSGHPFELRDFISMALFAVVIVALNVIAGYLPMAAGIRKL
ncbi:MAG: hypothetical protein HZB33_03215, partial [Nitrospirae bacterium]|nr:hypothetical protein [Nitrospirota bacterium]